MKAEIKGEDLLVYCNGWREIHKFENLNNIECIFNGNFRMREYTGTRTCSKNGELIFWFLPEHLPELKFN